MANEVTIDPTGEVKTKAELQEEVQTKIPTNTNFKVTAASIRKCLQDIIVTFWDKIKSLVIKDHSSDSTWTSSWSPLLTPYTTEETVTPEELAVLKKFFSIYSQKNTSDIYLQLNLGGQLDDNRDFYGKINICGKGNAHKFGILQTNSLTDQREWNLPNASGDIALSSEIDSKITTKLSDYSTSDEVIEEIQNRISPVAFITHVQMGKGTFESYTSFDQLETYINSSALKGSCVNSYEPLHDESITFSDYQAKVKSLSINTLMTNYIFVPIIRNSNY